MTTAYVVRHHKQWFRCPFCGHSRTASIRPRRPVGEWGERWWVGCTECDGDNLETLDGRHAGKLYLHRLAEAVGCRPLDLLQRGDEVLKDLLIRRARDVDSKGARLPSGVQVDASAAALKGAPLRYLTKQRGIDRDVLVKNKVGLDTSPAAPRLTFPMFDVIGRLVGIKQGCRGRASR